MKVPFVYAYSMASEGARELIEQMDSRLIRHKNSKFKWGSRLVINWGHANPPGPCLNQNIRPASNKLLAFKLFKEHNVPCPEFTEDHGQALEWVARKRLVFARTVLAGSEGEGIVLLNDAPDTKAKLYTQYIPKKAEYRVHVVNGEVIDVTEKRRANDANERRRLALEVHRANQPGQPKPFQVRNTANGYVFCHENVARIPAVLDAGLRAVKALGLDFGAVDVIWNEKNQAAYALEVNTAPGIAETSAKAYAKAFLKLAM